MAQKKLEGFDPSIGTGMARLKSKYSGSLKTSKKVRESQSVSQDESTEDVAQSPNELFNSLVDASDEFVDENDLVTENVPKPTTGVTTSKIVDTAKAYSDAISKSGGDVQATTDAAVVKATTTSRNRKPKTIRVSADVMDVVKSEFGDLTNPKALEAFVAYHAARPDLAPEEAREEVERRIREGVDASGMAAAVKSLARSVAELKTVVSIGSMASVAQLAHWYDEELGRSGVPISEWLGLSDSLFEIAGELSSQSAQYYEAMRRAHGRIPKGF